jgi:hypothetical protein
MAEDETFTWRFSCEGCCCQFRCRQGEMDHIGGHVAAVAGGIKLAVACFEGAVLEHNHQGAFTLYGDVQGHAVEGFILVELNDGGRDIGAEHTVSGKADTGGNEAELYVGVAALWQELLGGDVQATVYGENRREQEQLFDAGVAVKVEAPEVRDLIAAGLDKEPIKAVYEGAVVAHIQVGTDCITYKLSFPAGNAEVTGSTAGSGCLSHFVRHATEEIFAISAVADDVLESAGEFKYASLKGHEILILIKNKGNISMAHQGGQFDDLDQFFGGILQH